MPPTQTKFSSSGDPDISFSSLQRPIIIPTQVQAAQLTNPLVFGTEKVHPEFRNLKPATL